ncbi:MAG: response regulator [Pseudohongiellaceae bacterium]
MKVAIADDHEIFRMGLRLMLETLDAIDEVVEFESGLTLLDSLQESVVDLVVIDQSMPDCAGIEVLRQIDRLRPKPKRIFLTGSASSSILKEAKELGVQGLVAKRGSGEELLLAVHAVIENRSYVSPDFEELILQSSPLDTLTKREKEVLQGILEGKSTKAIADSLSVAFKTIDTHRNRLMQKLDAHSVAELMQFGRKHGLLKEI